MNLKPRPYQISACFAILKDVADGFHSLAALPTGSGKTIIIAGLVKKLQNCNKILILSHTEEILKQDHAALRKFIDLDAGLYSSGLGAKEIKDVTVAGIQSCYRCPEKFRDFDIVIIDEAHTIPRRADSMYQKLFKALKPTHQRIGLSATIFRTKSGYLHEGPDRMFNKLSYDLTSRESFNRLIDQGYLCPLITKSTDNDFDVTGVRTTGNDYNLKDLNLKFNRDEITKAALNEVVKVGKDYKSWLIFAINIEHANRINEILIEKGIKSACLHSRINGKRNIFIDTYKKQKIQALVSVGMVTTGFDAPNVDLLVMMRPTQSPVLYIQMGGRGTRIYPGKKHCLCLDFAGNVLRHGPINDVIVRKKYERIGKGEAPVKLCPKCKAHNHTMKKHCVLCGYEFVFLEKLETKASNAEIIKKSDSQWMNVDHVSYAIHKKKDKPNSLRVSYLCGIVNINEFICLDHGGDPSAIARQWINKRWISGDSQPFNVKELYNKVDLLKKPKAIEVQRQGRYFNVINADF